MWIEVKDLQQLKKIFAHCDSSNLLHGQGRLKIVHEIKMKNLHDSNDVFTSLQ